MVAFEKFKSRTLYTIMIFKGLFLITNYYVPENKRYLLRFTITSLLFKGFMQIMHVMKYHVHGACL